MPLNPSHIPRLVYDYLHHIGCSASADLFATECPYLTGLKFFAETAGNKVLPTMVGPPLIDIVHEYFNAKDRMFDITSQNNCQSPQNYGMQVPRATQSCSGACATAVGLKQVSCGGDKDPDISVVYSRNNVNQPHIVDAATSSSNGSTQNTQQVSKMTRQCQPEKPIHFAVNKSLAVDPDLAFAQQLVPTSTLCSLESRLESVGSQIPVDPARSNYITESSSNQMDNIRNVSNVTTDKAQNSAMVVTSGPRQGAASNSSFPHNATPEENARKCEEMFNLLLLKAAQHPRIHNICRLLIQNLVDEKISVESFAKAVQDVIIRGQSPTNALIPFLKICLPHFKRALAAGTLTIDGIRPPNRIMVVQASNNATAGCQDGPFRQIPRGSQRVVQLSNDPFSGTATWQITSQPNEVPRVPQGLVARAIPQANTATKPDEVHKILQWLLLPVSTPQSRVVNVTSSDSTNGSEARPMSSAESQQPPVASKAPMSVQPLQQSTALIGLLCTPLQAPQPPAVSTNPPSTSVQASAVATVSETIPSSFNQLPQAQAVSTARPASSAQFPPAVAVSNTHPISSIQLPQTQAVSTARPASSVQLPPAVAVPNTHPISSIQPPQAQAVSTARPASTIHLPPTVAVSNTLPISSIQPPPAVSVSNTLPSSSIQPPPAPAGTKTLPISSIQPPPAVAVSNTLPSSSIQPPPAAAGAKTLPNSSSQPPPAAAGAKTLPNSSSQPPPAAAGAKTLASSSIQPPPAAAGTKTLGSSSIQPPPAAAGAKTLPSSSIQPPTDPTMSPIIALPTSTDLNSQAQRSTPANTKDTSSNQSQPVKVTSSSPATTSTSGQPMTVVYRWSWESMQLTLDKNSDSVESAASGSEKIAQPPVDASPTPVVHDVEKSREEVSPSEGSRELSKNSTISKESGDVVVLEETITLPGRSKNKQQDKTKSSAEAKATESTESRKEENETSTKPAQMTPEETKALRGARQVRNCLAKWLTFVNEKCPESVAREVRMSIQALVDLKLDPGTFIKKVKPIFKSSPAPNFIPFMKENLPHLRKALSNKTLTLEHIRPPVISESDCKNKQIEKSQKAEAPPPNSAKPSNESPAIDNPLPCSSRTSTLKAIRITETETDSSAASSVTTASEQRASPAATDDSASTAQTPCSKVPVKTEPCDDDDEEEPVPSGSNVKKRRQAAPRKSEKRKRDGKEKADSRSVRRRVDKTSNPVVRPCSVILRRAFVWNSPKGPVQISQ